MKMTKFPYMRISSIFSLALLIGAGRADALEVRAHEQKIKSNYNITNVVDKLNREGIEKNLREFVASGRPSRFVGTPGHAKTREFIEAFLKAHSTNGASYVRQEFTPDIAAAGKFYADDFKNEVVAKVPKTDPNYDHWKGFTLSMMRALDSVKGVGGVNFIWEKKGKVSPSEVLVLGANYDTLLNDPKTMIVDTKGAMPGADNNGSGVAALMSMIEIFEKLDLPKTIRIVFFDFEELGFLGSRAYVEKLGDEKIAGYINLVMLAHDSKRDDKEKRSNNMKLYLRDPKTPGAEGDLALANQLTAAGKRLYSTIEFKPEANGMNSSSHINFWQAGRPAVCFSENWESDFNPRFHTPNDFVETLNMSTYVLGLRYITGSVLAWNYDIVK